MECSHTVIREGEFDSQIVLDNQHESLVNWVQSKFELSETLNPLGVVYGRYYPNRKQWAEELAAGRELIHPMRKANWIILDQSNTKID